MADEFTSAQSFGTPGDRPPPDETPSDAPTPPPKVPGPGKQFNGFTGEEEDAAPLNLSASPADQRILASPPHTDPLPDLIDRAVNSREGDAGVNMDEHVGPSLQEDALPGETPLPIIREHDTPELNTESEPYVPTQGVDAKPANDIAVDDQGMAVNKENSNDLPPYTGLDTKAYNDSLNVRKEAEAQGQELPEVQPPVPGGQDAPAEAAPLEPPSTPATGPQATPAEPIEGEPAGPAGEGQS